MKKLILLLFIITPIISYSQFTTSNPDTVCIGSSVATYQVENVLGYVYTWEAAVPGIITSGQGSNTITIDWSASSAGLIQDGVSVFATNEFGCVGDPIFLDVFILEIIPVIDPLVFCEGDPCADITFSPPGGTISGPNVFGTQYCPNLPGTTTMTYEITEAGCVFTATAQVITNPIPILQNISHD
jgi:hypothetical protein